MKIRSGFVSNSSSSSFVIIKDKITKQQIDKLIEIFNGDSDFYETDLTAGNLFVNITTESHMDEKIVELLEEVGVDENSYERFGD